MPTSKEPYHAHHFCLKTLWPYAHPNKPWYPPFGRLVLTLRKPSRAPLRSPGAHLEEALACVDDEVADRRPGAHCPHKIDQSIVRILLHGGMGKACTVKEDANQNKLLKSM